MTKVKSNREVIQEARREERTVHFATLMDICHLKNVELEPKFEKYKGRVVLRGDTVKDNSHSHAVFTEHRSSASRMTAAKVMDSTRMRRTSSQRRISLHKSTLEDASKLLKIPKSECPNIWVRLPRHNGLNHGPAWKTLWFFLNEICDNFKKFCLGLGWENSATSGMLVCLSETGPSLSVYVDDTIMAGRKQNVSFFVEEIDKIG